MNTQDWSERMTYKLPEGDRFKDPSKFRILGTGQGDTLYECWNSAIQLQLRAAYAAGLAAERERCALVSEQAFRFAKDGYEIADLIREGTP
jgi:hypothetical protein